MERLTPSFVEEERLMAQGYRFIAGIDEAGRGSLAGPVVAAAIMLPAKVNFPWLDQIRDSKQLSPVRRELLFYHLHEVAIAVGLGVVHHDAIDAIGIVKATQLAMKLAIEQLSPHPQYLLIDYMHLPGVRFPQKGVIDGDSLCFSIACASIIAKVSRDRMMVRLDKVYPGYGLAQHKGYCTEEHFSCLCQLGPSPIHRCSFRPVKDTIKK
jgi:ribonuclease HII